MEAFDLETRPLNVSISDNGTITSSNHVRIKLQSRLNSYTAAIECIVIDQVTDKIPAVSSGRNKFNFPRNIRLIDTRFHTSSDIDLLIGAELFWNLICVGQVKSSDKHPTLQKTRLGWILAGRLGSTISTASKVHSFHASVTNAELHEHVSRAWTTIPAQSDNYTMEEHICERHFGPIIQQDLISILMRFHLFTYVITADIIKMYLQILVHPPQTRLQRILWRDDLSANIDTYELTIVTYLDNDSIKGLNGLLPASRINISRSFSCCDAHMYSDNGTTFLGAHRQIQELYDIYNDQQVQSEIKDFLREEAAVKSAKCHMTRIVGKAHLTFEEMQTQYISIITKRKFSLLKPIYKDLKDLKEVKMIVDSLLRKLHSRKISREAFLSKGIPEEAIKIFMASVNESFFRQYDCSLKKWWFSSVVLGKPKSSGK
ncbi:hypothetical protein ALC53_07201 [Atta colombica]|uniref:Uncharacterized protein n=1 Tax=Atta colombica TaxID=520822 RepID=A0A195BCX7_9HYME|nr:hypothetical protein ALC53_07201 [Atta colombica]